MADEYGQTPLSTLLEGYDRGSTSPSGGRADLNQAMEMGLPLFIESQKGHLDAVRCLAEAGLTLSGTSRTASTRPSSPDRSQRS